MGIKTLSTNRTVDPRIKLSTQTLESEMLSRIDSAGFRKWLVPLAVCLFVTPVAMGQDDDSVPGAPHLFPEEVYVYGRLDNANDFRDDLKTSSIGRMLADPQMRPFADDVYKTGRELFDQVANEVGVSLDELLDIPSGQVAFAVFPGNPPEEDSKANQNEDDESEEAIQRRLRQRRRNENSFAGAIIVDAGKNVDTLMTLVDQLKQRMVQDGFLERSLKVRKTEITRMMPRRPREPQIEIFERDGVVVVGFGHRIGQDILDRWDDKSDEPTLADSSNFTNVMSRCVGAEATQPQFTFYFDPYHLAETIVLRSGSLTVGFIWPIVQGLGVERIRGLGGSSFRGGDIFEDIVHLHILVDPPRDGLLGVLRPKTGDIAPPKWIPSDVTSYTTVFWDLDKTYENLAKIFETFQGPDALKRLAEDPLKSQVGLEMQEDILDNLTGRYVRAVWMEPPARINSGSTLNAMELSDPAAAKKVITKLRDKFPNFFEPETIAGKVVYFTPSPGGDNFPQGFRRPEPCMVILDNWLVGSDSRKLIERVLRANSGVGKNLMDVAEYDLVTSELGGKLDGEKPFMLSYAETGDFVKQIYNLVQADDTKGFLRGQDDPVARGVSDLLGRHKLPPYEKFEKYFAPTGSFAYDEPNGMHFAMFTLRADATEAEKERKEKAKR